MPNVRETTAADIMHKGVETISSTATVAEALRPFSNRQATALTTCSATRGVGVRNGPRVTGYSSHNKADNSRTAVEKLLCGIGLQQLIRLAIKSSKGG